MEITFMGILWIVFLVFIALAVIRIFFSLVLPLIILGVGVLVIKIKTLFDKKGGKK